MIKKKLASALIGVLLLLQVPMVAVQAASLNMVDKIPTVAVGTGFTGATATKLILEEAYIGGFGGSDQEFNLILSDNARWPDDVAEQLKAAMPDPPISGGYTYHASVEKLNDVKLSIRITNLQAPTNDKLQIVIPIICTVTDVGNVTVDLDGLGSYMTSQMGIIIAKATDCKIYAYRTMPTPVPGVPTPGVPIPPPSGSGLYGDAISPGADKVHVGTIQVNELVPRAINNKLHLESKNTAYDVDLSKAEIKLGNGLAGCKITVLGSDIIFDTVDRSLTDTGTVVITGAQLTKVSEPLANSRVTVAFSADDDSKTSDVYIGLVTPEPIPEVPGTHSSVNKVPTVLVGKTLEGYNAPRLSISENAPGVMEGKDQTFRIQLTKAVWTTNAVQSIKDLVQDPLPNLDYGYHSEYVRVSDTELEVKLTSVRESATNCISLQIPLVSTIQEQGEAQVKIISGDSVISDAIWTYAFGSAPAIISSVGSFKSIDPLGDKVLLGAVSIEERAAGSMPGVLHIACNDSAYRLDLSGAVITSYGGIPYSAPVVNGQDVIIDLSKRRDTVGGFAISNVYLIKNSTPVPGSVVSIQVTSDNPAIKTEVPVGKVLSPPAAPVIPTPAPTAGGGGGGGGGGNTTEVLVNGITRVELPALTMELPAGVHTSNFWLKTSMTSFVGLKLEEGTRILSDMWSIQPEGGATFGKPCKLSLSYSASKVDSAKETVSLYWLDEKTKEWQELDGITVENGKVTGTTQKHGIFALLVKPKTATLPVEPVALGVPTLELKDIKGHWAEGNIVKLMGKKAISGNPDGTFQPEKQVTRAEFITMLVKALELKGTTDKTYPDLKGHWAEETVKIAVANGVLSGFEDGTIRPEALITREQMAVMIFKAAKLQSGKPEKLPADEATISPWAKDSVLSAMKGGIISGYADNTFRPAALATKAEAVTIIARCIL